MRPWRASGIAALTFGAAVLVQACDGGDGAADTEVDYNEVQEAQAMGPEDFKARFEEFRGKRVQWSGTVVESMREFGDDYVEIGTLLVDMDMGVEGLPEADVAFEIKPSQIEQFSGGDPVDFTGVIREYRTEKGNILLRLQVKEVRKGV
jgi:hypothetical protein